MRLTAETDCVVSFVSSTTASQSQRTSSSYSTSSLIAKLSSLFYNSKRKKRKQKDRKTSFNSVMLLQSFLHLLKTLFLIFKQLIRHTKRKVIEIQTVKYCDCPLSPSSELRLFSVRRKLMVLDLDETLIHSHHDNTDVVPLNNAIPDFYVRVFIENHPVKFYVYKRPYVDFFLSVICQWYDLVIFTASMQKYGMEVANHLDQNRGILPRRYFRQNCTMDMNGYTKDLSMVSEDLSNIFILDNSPSAYRGNPDNAIPIKSWFSDPLDTDLLDLLPFLDSLRFTQDVRSVLSRNLHQHSLW